MPSERVVRRRRVAGVAGVRSSGRLLRLKFAGVAIASAGLVLGLVSMGENLATPKDAATTSGLPNGAVPPAALTCTVSLANPYPSVSKSTFVEVHTAADATVTAVAHYLTTTMVRSGTAPASGNLGIGFNVGSNAAGETVSVRVIVSKGHQVSDCRTSFKEPPAEIPVPVATTYVLCQNVGGKLVNMLDPTTQCPTGETP